MSTISIWYEGKIKLYLHYTYYIGTRMHKKNEGT